MKVDKIDHGGTFDFGKTAAQYAKYRDIYPDLLYEKLYALGIGHRDERWLDLGTGTGVLPLNMFEHGAKITGADISPEQIAAAKTLALDRGADIDFIVSSAEDTGLTGQTFDCITAAQCFWYFDREKIISEIQRLIKPGGVFVKIYMTYTLDDEIAKMSHSLVKRMNKNWTPGASGSRDMYNHPFENPTMEVFSFKLPFTRETWHGRMCACRGTTASMDAQTLEKWSDRHQALLSTYPAEFTVNHKIYIAAYRVGEK